MIKFLAAATIILMSSVGAIAAPYCLIVPNGSPLCQYVDGASCAADANRQNGSCQVNPYEVHLPASRVGEYCLIMPNGASRCGYADGAVCSRDAIAQKGVCQISAGAGTQRIPDDYAPNAGR
jgi:hypothetical protein